MKHLDDDELTLLALTDVDARSANAHLAECAVCRGEYDALRNVVGLGREADADDLDPPLPPPGVWTAIRAELDAEQPAEPRMAKVDAVRGTRRLLLSAAAAVLGVVVGIGATLGWQAVTRPRTPAPTVVATSRLVPPPGAPLGGSGSVRLVRQSNRLVLEINADDLPLTNGFYEAWMFVPGTTRMQAMGTVEPGGTVRFPVPEGLDPAGWRGIDISAETFDGNPAHSATSVLRGELRR